MKIGNKLFIGFMVIASLVGFVGIFSAVSHNNIQTNNEITTKVFELDNLIDESLVKLLALIQAETVEDYIREKSDYEQTRAEFDTLFKQLNNEYVKRLPDLGFNVIAFRKNTGELARISNRLIDIHKRSLAKNKASEEKKSLEKELRPRIKNALVALQDEALTRDVEQMQYKSKEAIYQYKDQKYGLEWLDSISKVKNNPLIVPLQDVSKDLDAYERVAKDLCKIIVEQKTIETQEYLVFGELKELINRIEEDQTGIVDKIKAESHTLSRNTHLTMFAVIIGASLVSIILGLTIARSISKPVANLAQATHAIAQGDFSVRVDVATADEIGELASSFNKMAEDLQKTTTSIANLNREIIERKKAEQRQAQLLEQLEKINQELKDFAYIVSHDLKAPLRGIKTLADWISTDYADKLDENGKEQMSLLTNRVDRMHNLIDGVLQYSRVGRVKEDIVQINLNELISEVIDLLAPPENISIAVENELPTIECEQTRIMQVFQNLLSNAVKYMDKPQGQIKVGCVEEDGFWEFYVADNGPGIEEKYFEKIFQLFQTLARRDKSESTGVGLTIIKKIVEMYGGKIWVRSKVGEGSTFFFTLPKTLSVTNNEKQLLTSSR